MQVSTKGIVLGYTKYSDSSIILQLYTQELGKVSLIVYGISNKKKNKLVYFQSLYLLDVIISHKDTRQVQSLKELKINPVLPELSADFIKGTQAMFLAEVLQKSLKSTEPDLEVFDFLYHAIQMLNAMESNYHFFHLAFMSKFARFLGIWFEPDNFHSGFYDFRSGHLAVEKPTHPYYMTLEVFNTCKSFVHLPFDSLAQIKLNKNQRDLCLTSLVKLYEYHVTDFNQLNALGVLNEVFS